MPISNEKDPTIWVQDDFDFYRYFDPADSFLNGQPVFDKVTPRDESDHRLKPCLFAIGQINADPFLLKQGVASVECELIAADSSLKIAGTRIRTLLDFMTCRLALSNYKQAGHRGQEFSMPCETRQWIVGSICSRLLPEQSPITRNKWVNFPDLSRWIIPPIEALNYMLPLLRQEIAQEVLSVPRVFPDSDSVYKEDDIDIIADDHDYSCRYADSFWSQTPVLQEGMKGKKGKVLAMSATTGTSVPYRLTYKAACRPMRIGRIKICPC